ncbi:serine hydrolase [Methanoculleus sp. FWC-SCC1]|uniref:Serine hydrolase n=2 Tax=Methanoculleus frigidifontis TaxID=2584085 RepID=A0ABT8M8M7_9EURY|nr:serine hydrolase [Methanoculleus sp. FWC-SCC1]
MFISCFGVSLTMARKIVSSVLISGIIVTMVIFAGTLPATAASDARLEGFDAYIEKMLADYEVPGAVVGIVEGDRVIYLKGFGVREIGEPGTVDENTRFQVASVTKWFTGAAIGTIVDEGKLSWDTPVVEYIPEFALKDEYAGRYATLRDLLAHRAGLAPYGGELLGRIGYSNEEILHRTRYLEPAASFRERYLYSNVGYFVAGEVAARIDNRSWEDLTRERILVPLGMTRSGTTHETMYLDSNHASGHAGYGLDLETIPLESASMPAAGQIVSTGADMTRWVRMLVGNGTFEGEQILAPATLMEIMKPSMVSGPGGPLGDPNGATGLGCDSYRFLEYRVVEKNGALDGVRSIVAIVPKEQIGIVVIANKQLTAFPEAVRCEFLERFLGRAGVDLQEKTLASQKIWDSLILSPDIPADAHPQTRDSADFAGTYMGSLFGDLRVIAAGDVLTVEIGRVGFPGNLTHVTDNVFWLSWPNPDDQPGYITFTTGPDGSVNGIDSKTFGRFTRTGQA